MKWIGTEAILDIRPTSAAGWAKGKANVTVQNPVAPQRIEVFEVQFAAQHWLRADWLIRHRLVSSPARPDSEPTTTPSPTHTPANVEDPTPPQERAKPVVQAPSVPRLPDISEIAALPQAPPRRSTIAAIRADDGKRQVWLWQQGGKIHASLAPVGEAPCHRLDPTEVALLLLTEPLKAMPAIHALTNRR